MNILKAKHVIPLFTIVVALIVLFFFIDPFKSFQNTSLDNWLTYKSKDYEIKYPKDWKAESLPVASGSILIIKPSSLKADEYYPSLTIESSSETTDDIKRIQDIYIRTGFVKSEVVFNGENVDRVGGTANVKLVSGKPINSSTQENIIFIKRPNSLYTVQYQYDGDKINTAMEKNFSGMISTLKFY